MIGKLKGLVDSFDEDGLIVDVGGVGYLVAASARTLRALPATGEAVALHIETQVREDAIRLFGFLTVGERDWFRLLQGVQGVGAKVALGILGALTGEALSAAILHQDKAMMARAPGVGPKLAARLVLELKDKAPALGVADLCREHGVSDASIYKWKAKFGGLDVSEANRLRSLEDENTKLKRLLADAMLDNAALKDLLGKKW